MRATGINHVSISATDLETSARFYEEVFGMERIPTAKFRGPVLWLRLGEQQLHLFESSAEAPRFHHFALDVDDFEGVYRRVKELGLLDSDTHGAPLREHPTGWVQQSLYYVQRTNEAWVAAVVMLLYYLTRRIPERRGRG